jgi:2-polyprenyl-3-methyl-5-hydroxy-6-metoxy-1,4-benzoquinol methylase
MTILSLPKLKLNDINLLNELKNSCYTGNDVRASWITEYLIDTDILEFKNFANWSLQHWNMYKGFLNNIELNNEPLYILDAACGIGFNTKMLSENIENATLFGIDLDENSITLANKYNSDKNIIYKVGDLLSYSFEFKFKYIFFLEILEHINANNHYIIIDKLLNLLTEDGLLFITTPNELDNPDCNTEHIGLLNRERTQQFINKYKKNIIESQFYDNSKLLTDDNIIDESIETYQITSSGVGGISTAPNKSHFKLVLSQK